MSSSAPLVSHDSYRPPSSGLGPSSSSLNMSGGDEEDQRRAAAKANEKTKSGMKTTILIVTVLLIVATVLGVVINHRHSDRSDPEAHKQRYGLEQMFNRSLTPKSASLAWIESGDADQFISVVNGSFYLTTLPEYDAPKLLIDAADLQPFAQLSAPSQQQSKGPHGPAGMGVSTPMAHTRPVPGHVKRTLPESQQVEAELAEEVAAQQTKTAQLFSLGAADAASFEYSSYDLSPDQKFMLFGTNCRQLYRHSSFCRYLLYDISAKSMLRVAASAELRLAVWSPTSTHLAYVQDNNIFVLELANSKVSQVTTDGQWDQVINGVMDWVYEEEIAQATAALWWAPDGSKIAFLRFDETQVPKYQFSFYLPPGESRYNQEFSYKYPKVGAKNSVVSVFTYDLQRNSVMEFEKPIRAAFDYEYVINVAWFNGEQLLVRLSNRLQNDWRLVKCQRHASGAAQVTSLSTQLAQWYHEPHSLLTSLSPLPFYIDLVNSDSTDPDEPAPLGKGDHLHLALFSVEDGERVKFLTEGDYDVLNLDAVRVDEQEQSVRIYYTRELTQTDAKVAAPTMWMRQVSVATANADEEPVQLLPADSGATSQTASYSPSASYVLVQESVYAPTTTLYRFNSTSSLESLKLLADNRPLVQDLAANYRLPHVQFTTIPGTLYGTFMSAKIMAPNELALNCELARRRPVLIHAYGGPGSQQVTPNYWMTYGSQAGFHGTMVSDHEWIVVQVDPIGTAGKGEQYRKGYTYKQLGIHEREDMITAAKWIGEQCWADSSNINYWGWSYGGFMTSFTAQKGTNLFKHLISVAPVTDWRLYDSVYTERYMQTPETNLGGYQRTSVIEKADSSFDGHAWNLFAGTADDNVHWQNSVLLIDKLVDLDMPMNTFAFPNRAHSLNQWKTGAAPKYLFQKLTHLLTGKQGPNGNKDKKEL